MRQRQRFKEEEKLKVEVREKKGVMEEGQVEKKDRMNWGVQEKWE